MIQGSVPKSDPVLPPNFSNDLMALEFNIEKGNATKETIQEIMAMYTQAAEYYDFSKETQLSEIYRQKIVMMFMRPAVLTIYNAPTATSRP
jgi:hypothetical protein